MLKNYLAVAVRVISREKGYAFINIIGLAIGLAICLLVMVYIIDEWSFDRFHTNHEQLYRVNLVTDSGTGHSYLSATPFPLRQMILDNVPEVEAVARLTGGNRTIVRIDGKSYREEASFTDPDLLTMFSFSMLRGDASTALKDPSSIVLSAPAAERMFGSLDVVGRSLTLTMNGAPVNYTVSGVVTEPPSNSTLSFNILIKAEEVTKHQRFEPNWGVQWPETYVKIRPDADPMRVTEQLDAAGAVVPQRGGYEGHFEFSLQPFSNLHLNPNISTGRPVSSPMYSYLLGAIGLIVLLLACINFTTLAIGRSQRRVREIGVRKVMGASVKQLYVQLLGEALIISAIALVLAFALAELCLPIFNDLAGKQISSVFFSTGWWSIGIVGLVMLTAVFAGGYPAAVLTRTRSVEAVRGRSRLLTGGALTRTLVTIQFTLSAALIVVTLTMSNHLDVLQSRPLGFNQEQLVMVALNGASGEERLAIIERLRAMLNESHGVLAVSATGADFSGSGARTTVNVGPDSVPLSMWRIPADHEYVRTMQLELVAGSDFREPAPTGFTPVIVNEKFIEKMRWQPHDAIGQEIPRSPDQQIVGVVKDYHFRPLAYAIQPVTILQATVENSYAAELFYVYLRLAPENIPATMQRLENAWKKAAPNLPFSFQFMDDHIEAQYQAYERWADIMRNAAMLAVIVACFGVFGLTALAIARRRKELGIRKVLGAKASQLVALLNREFVILAVAGNVIAWPLAYYAAGKWLENFAYRTPISPWPFAAGILMLLAIVVLTVSAQAIRAAKTNPTEAIRYE